VQKRGRRTFLLSAGFISVAAVLRSACGILHFTPVPQFRSRAAVKAGFIVGRPMIDMQSLEQHW